jgi:hypothetical protein
VGTLAGEHLGRDLTDRRGWVECGSLSPDAARTKVRRKSGEYLFELGLALPLRCENSGSRHIVTVSRRLDGREEREERPGGPPPNHEPARAENVRIVYIVCAAETASEIREGEPGEQQ